MDLSLYDGPTACEMDATCLASPDHKGEAALCKACKWSPDEPENGRDCFRQEKGDRTKFARKEASEYAERRAVVQAKLEIKASKDKGKARLGRKAVAAEKMTQRRQKGITETRNSGRTNKDGDHDYVGRISLDTKLQTGNVNPVINLTELAKIQADANRVGNAIGVLVLRNKYNVGVVAISEADWQTILQWLS